MSTGRSTPCTTAASPPVLAVRDGNITPALLKRKFGTDARAVYPKLSTRLALSERGGGRPYALLMREGLMPYAEVVLGSKRLCASAKRCTVLAFLAATASTLLAFYLTFVGAYSVLTPFSLLIYVLFVVAQRAGRRPAQRPLLTLRTKKTKICGKIWL